MVSSFEPTSAGKVTHTCLKLLGILCFLAALPPLAFLLSKSAKVQLQNYRWFLLGIVLSGVAMDVHISLLMSPYPLVPHIAFWADGILVYVHPRAILYLLAIALALAYLWITSLLLAFTFQLHKLSDLTKKSGIFKVALAFAVIGVFNMILTDTVLLQYPSQKEIERLIRESIPEMTFLFILPAYIYFVQVSTGIIQNYIFAVVGLAHTLIATVFYVAVFLLIFWQLYKTLNKSRNVMSEKTVHMHRIFINALKVQILLPMFFMAAPILIAAVIIKFGSTNDDGERNQLISNICLLFVCSHSPINTAAMFLFMGAFRRFFRWQKPSILAAVDPTTITSSTIRQSVSIQRS